MKAVKKTADTRRAELLESARHLLIQDGARALTLRGLANEVGLKLASVQYYFPTHAALITALVEDRLEQQKTDIQRLQEKAGGTAREMLDTVLRWWTIDSEETTDEGRLDVQFWALAEIDATAKRALSRYQHLYVFFLSDLIRKAVGVTKRQATARAVAIASLVEGSVLFVDLSDESAPGHNCEKDIYNSACLIAFQD